MADETRPQGLIPYLTIRDGRASEASAFYQRAFGARELNRHLAQDGKRLMHCDLALHGDVETAAINAIAGTIGALIRRSVQ